MTSARRLKAHPAADLFPMMLEAELAELAADIKAHGQHEAIIVTSENLILDGRNRYEACRRAGVEPDILMWDREDDGVSPTEWVLSKNLHRRHLNESQRAMVAAKALPMLEAEARKRMGKKGAPRGAPSSEAPKKPQRSSESAAKAVGASSRSVERAKAVLASAPKAEVDAVLKGEKTLKQVERETRRAEQVRQVRQLTPPVGEYGVIAVDPPWRFDDALDGSDAARGGTPYPTMSIEEIAALSLPVAKDCCVFLWVTNSHLIDPSAYAVCARAWRERYQLEPKQIRTWAKTRMGLGTGWRNITEHLVRFERGSPVLTGVTQTTLIAAGTGAHSEKPPEVYRDIEAMCASTSRLELFARAQRDGWITNGAELPKSKAREPVAEPRALGLEAVDGFRFRCESCGHAEPKWEGKCPECGAWGALIEREPQEGPVERAPKKSRKKIQIKDVEEARS
jgi:N6-adenosine-specific RNA methylase IME4